MNTTSLRRCCGLLVRAGRARLAILGLLVTAPAAYSQVVVNTPSAQLTTEAFANFTTGEVIDTSGRSTTADDFRFDGGARLLGRLRFDDGPDIGVRIAGEANENNARLVEASVLVFGGRGRFEIGERMGLPDVLTGYAPNNFQFTSAEFGPASGPSLDPAGRLQTVFLPASLAAQIDRLAGLGVTAALFDDQSAKILYVSPKKHGWLGGISYARDADDETVAELVQVGLTHESYWQQNVLRWGGTYAYGRAVAVDGQTPRDLNSVSLGVSLTLDDALMLGVAASYDGRSRLPIVSEGRLASAAWGATVSANYNVGPWTMGAYYQYASAEGSTLIARNDRLSVVALGASYRFTTKLRLYGAWYRFDFEDDDLSEASLSEVGNVFVLGLRLTL